MANEQQPDNRLQQIEEDLDASRNVLARQRLVGIPDHDLTPHLLWKQALDHGEFLLQVIRSMAERGAMVEQAFQGLQERLQGCEAVRGTLEAENTRLTEEAERFYLLLQDHPQFLETLHGHQPAGD